MGIISTLATIAVVIWWISNKSCIILTLANICIVVLFEIDIFTLLIQPSSITIMLCIIIGSLVKGSCRKTTSTSDPPMPLLRCCSHSSGEPFLVLTTLINFILISPFILHPYGAVDFLLFISILPNFLGCKSLHLYFR